MKIIKKPKIPIQTCRCCGSVLEVEHKDLRYSAWSLAKTIFKCKFCKTENEVNFKEEIDGQEK